MGKKAYMEKNAQSCNNCGWADKTLEHMEVLKSRGWVCNCPKNIFKKYNLVTGEYYPAKHFASCLHNVGTDYCEWVKMGKDTDPTCGKS